jgi:hypothetical protein
MAIMNQKIITFIISYVGVILAGLFALWIFCWIEDERFMAVALPGLFLGALFFAYTSIAFIQQPRAN